MCRRNVFGGDGHELCRAGRHSRTCGPHNAATSGEQQRTSSVPSAFRRTHRAFKKRQDEFGFGRLPLSFADAMECTPPDQVHVLFVDEIARGDIVGYQLPLPRYFTGPAKMSVTLAYASPVEPTQPTEYTSASLELTLRPHRNMFRFFSPPTGSDEPAREIDLASSEARTLLMEGWKAGQEPVAKNPHEHNKFE